MRTIINTIMKALMMFNIVALLVTSIVPAANAGFTFAPQSVVDTMDCTDLDKYAPEIADYIAKYGFDVLVAAFFNSKYNSAVAYLDELVYAVEQCGYDVPSPFSIEPSQPVIKFDPSKGFVLNATALIQNYVGPLPASLGLIRYTYAVNKPAGGSIKITRYISIPSTSSTTVFAAPAGSAWLKFDAVLFFTNHPDAAIAAEDYYNNNNQAVPARRGYVELIDFIAASGSSAPATSFHIRLP